MTEPTTTVLHIRVDVKAYDTLGDKAKALGKKSSDLMREMIDAFNEDRLTITPTTGQMKLFGIDEKE